MKKIKNKVKKFFYNNKFILLSFIIPFIIMSITFAYYDIAPFGIFKSMINRFISSLGQLFPSWNITSKFNPRYLWGKRQILVIDSWHQYYPFLSLLHKKLQSGSSLLYSWEIGMGSNFISIMSYYLLSPLNFISVIIPEKFLVQYFAISTIIKISCIGAFTAISLRIITKKNDLSLVICSIIFSFCAFNMGYYWCTIWLDSVAMMPLCVAGTISLLKDKKFKLFTISLSLAIIFNFYIGLFICIAILITCIGYEIIKYENLKKVFKDFFCTLFFTIISLLITSPITNPAYIGLQNTYKQKNGIPANFVINTISDSGMNTTITNPNIKQIMTTTTKIISNMLSFVKPTIQDGLPNISCSILCILLATIFLQSKKIKKSEKIFCTAILLFLIASFFIRHLDFVWHGLHYPNSLPSRFSFLFSFLLIYMSFRGFCNIKDIKLKDIIITSIIFALIALTFFQRNEQTYIPLIGSCTFAIIYITLLLLRNFNVLNIHKFTNILLFITIIEITITSFISVKTVSTTSISNYSNNKENITTQLEKINDLEKENQFEIYRTEMLNPQTLNDGALYNYNGISTFNSMANVNVTKYLERLGIGAWQSGNRYTYYETSPVTNTILNIKYFISSNNRINNISNNYYNKIINSQDGTLLFENTAYLPIGYVTNKELLNWKTEDNSIDIINPFEEQNNFWNLATKIDEPLYNKLEITYLKTNTYIEYSTKANNNGMILFYINSNNRNENKVKIFINDNINEIKSIKRPHISIIGTVENNDKITIQTDLENENNTTIYCYQLNDEVFKKGLEILSKSNFKTTYSNDTKINGTIIVEDDGLFLTSIPYEEGWKAYVDNKEVKITALANAMIAFPITKGEHNIKLKFTPKGLITGIILFIIGITIFVITCIITSKCKKKAK